MLLRTTRVAPTLLTPLRANPAVSRSAARAMSTSYNLTSYIVSPEQLNDALQKNVHSKLSTAPRVIPLCGTWFLPNDARKRTGASAFHKCRIPSARFFDLDAVKDAASPYPHMLPSAQEFAAAMGKLGIKRDDSVVVYDSEEEGVFSAPRVAWTLRAFGHPGVHVLNNFKLWCELGLPTAWGESIDHPEPVEYPVPQLDEARVASFEQVREVARKQAKEGSRDVQILDARSKGRWEGSQPEPRPGLSSGHIPTSFSLPLPTLLDPKDKTLRPAADLKAIFADHGISPEKQVISSCGTGVMAAVLDAALAEAGFPEEGRRVYDGSWTEWAMRAGDEEGLVVKGAE